MDRRTFLATAPLVTGSMVRPARAQGSGTRKLKLVTPWPKDAPGLSSSANRLAKMISESSQGRIQVDVFSAGELVDAFEVFDAVSEGIADMYHSPEYYWQDKSPAFSFFASVPFGLTANEMAAWIHHGGGQALWDELSGQFNLKPLLAASTGVQMGGWYDREVNSIDSFKGLRIRMPGLGGEILKKMGAIVVSLPGGEIVPALQSGAINASEWVCPWLDVHLGLDKAARYYYYPGFQEPGPGIALGLNKDLWDDLDRFEKQVFITASAAEFTLSLAEFNTQNALVLQAISEQDIEMRRFDAGLLREVRKISTSLLEELAADQPLTRRILDSFTAFRESQMQWSSLADLAFLHAREQAYTG